jgi:hypothetical protein
MKRTPLFSALASLALCAASVSAARAASPVGGTLDLKAQAAILQAAGLGGGAKIVVPQLPEFKAVAVEVASAADDEKAKFREFTAMLHRTTPDLNARESVPFRVMAPTVGFNYDGTGRLQGVMANHPALVWYWTRPGVAPVLMMSYIIEPHLYCVLIDGAGKIVKASWRTRETPYIPLDVAHAEAGFKQIRDHWLAWTEKMKQSAAAKK